MNEAKSIGEWFLVYSESHKNKINKLIHFFCVPAIYFTVMGFLWAIPTPALFESIPGLNWASIATLFVLGFYIRLSALITLGMAFFSMACLFVLSYMEQSLNWNVLYFSIGLFVVSWILQFVGHAIEGKKPSFFQDLQFLMIGPAWVMGFVFQKAGIQLK